MTAAVSSGESPTVDVRLARLTAAVDQVLALIDEAMRAHTGNRELVDVCLDVKNTIRGGPPT